MHINKKSSAAFKVGKSLFMQNFLKRIDIFGQSLPTFNLKGETTVPTLTGGLCTFLIICVFLTYGSLKFVHLIEKHNPQFSQVTE